MISTEFSLSMHLPTLGRTFKKYCVLNAGTLSPYSRGEANTADDIGLLIK